MTLKRRVVIPLVLLILLPLVLLGTVFARVMLVPVIASESYDAFRTHLDREIPALVQTHGVPGAAVALVHDGDVWVKGYGSADIETARPVTANTVFQAASVSKSVSAWGVMRLVEQGELDLDVPVSRYLTRWHLPDSAFDTDGVTARSLLSHTAGLSVGGYLGYHPTTSLPSLETELSVGADAAVQPGGVRVIYPPGEKVHYSGGGYTVLQLLVEEVSGQTFAEFMREQVLVPLGMTNSTYEWSTEVQEMVATPFGTDGTALPQYRFVAKAAGGLFTTAPDLARFVAATIGGEGVREGGRVLAPETLALMLSSAPNATTSLGPLQVAANGLGYAIDPVVLGDGEIVGHDGSNQGWRTAFLALPSEREGMVILTNSDAGGAVNEEVKCAWVDYATGRSTPTCLNMQLANDGTIALGIWLALVLGLVVRRRRMRLREAGRRGND